MYDLPHHKERDQEEVIRFMKEHPFVFIIGADKNNKPVASQIPVFIDEKDGKYFLTGHIMRNTDHHKAFVENNKVMAIFSGPHTYVSATWYSDPYKGSTWNYINVQARGTIRFGDQEELKMVLQRLSLHYENSNEQATTVFNNLPNEYTERMIKAIVPFEIEIKELEHVFKLSQDRDEKSYDNIIEKLKEKGGDAKTVAEIMEKRKSQVFPS